VETGDLLEKLGFTRPQSDEDDIPDVPDDVSSLTDDEPEEEDLPKDPRPARRTAKTGRGRSSGGSATKATPAERRLVKDALTLMIKGPAGFLAMKDPHCGGVALEQADAMVKAFTPIICRNATMLSWFTAAGAPWLDYLAIISAVGPVAGAVWSHHVTHTVDVDQDGQEAPHADLSSYAVPA
jgi:hypothetical protein